MSGLTHASLCMGIGGLDLAVESVYGSRLAWFSEIEPAPCTVIERHWSAPNIGDLTTFDWASAEPVDILTAGYPCQPFSHAGKRKGKNDARHLWPFIAEAVRVLRPSRVVLENVRGHLSLGFDEVLGSLAEAGFDAEWCVLRASDVGACHQRARVFIVAADANGIDGRGRPEARRVSETAGPGDPTTPADARRERHGTGQDAGAVGRVDRRDEGEAQQRQRPWEVAGDRGAAAVADADGVHDDRSRDLGPGGRAEPADSGEAAADADSDGLSGLAQQHRPPATRLHGAPGGHVDGRRLEVGRSAALGQDEPAVDWGAYAAAIDRWERTLGRPAPRPTDDAGRLSPDFVEWMMGYPAGWVDGLTRTQALKALGNAVVPQQGIAAISLLEAAHLAEAAAA